MMFSFLRSMTARIFLILVGGTLITGTMVVMLATYERKDLEEHLRVRHTAERVQQIMSMLEVVPASARPGVADVAGQYGIRVDLAGSMTLIGKVPDSEITLALRAALGNDREITVLQSEGPDCPARRPSDGMPTSSTHRCEIVLSRLKDGTPVRLDVAHRDRPPPPFRGNFLRDLLLFLSGLTLIALAVSHMATKPLRALARAAHDLSANIEHAPLAIDTGSQEVRDAAQAFNSMQQSIRRHIEERTCMLAAIAHDLQTPLTRLRLRLEKVQDTTLRSQLVKDLLATQNMVKEGLEFVRTLTSHDPFEQVDIDSLVEAACNDALDTGHEVTFSGHVGAPVHGSPHALRRCIANLLDNALKYGRFAHVSVSRTEGKAVISIIDGGPGIPENQLERVFQPFNRLEEGHAGMAGGTGLGLTITRIIAEKHHGNVRLKNLAAQDELGLIATLELPLA